jgi:hypothetical protein
MCVGLTAAIVPDSFRQPLLHGVVSFFRSFGYCMTTATPFLTVRLIEEVSGRQLSRIRLPAEFRDDTVTNAAHEAVKDFVGSRELPLGHQIAVIRCCVDACDLAPDVVVSTVVGPDAVMTIYVSIETRPASAVGSPAVSAMPASDVVTSSPRSTTSQATPHRSASAVGHRSARSVSPTTEKLLFGAHSFSSTSSPWQWSDDGEAVVARVPRVPTAFAIRDMFVAGRSDVYDGELCQRIEDAFQELVAAKRLVYTTRWVARDGKVGVRVSVRGVYSRSETSVVIETRRILQELGAPIYDPDVHYLYSDVCQ